MLEILKSFASGCRSIWVSEYNAVVIVHLFRACCLFALPVSSSALPTVSDAKGCFAGRLT